MGTQGTHENSIEEMVKWTLGHSKCERPATGGYHTLGSAVSQFGPYLKGKYFYHFMQSQIFWGVKFISRNVYVNLYQAKTSNTHQIKNVRLSGESNADTDHGRSVDGILSITCTSLLLKTTTTKNLTL